MRILFLQLQGTKFCPQRTEQGTGSPLEPAERNSLADTLILAWRDPYWISDLQNCSVVTDECLKPHFARLHLLSGSRILMTAATKLEDHCAPLDSSFDCRLPPRAPVLYLGKKKDRMKMRSWTNSRRPKSRILSSKKRID
ncbi:uncharacterized protein [Desmodus rotundus]|uniref:uncharacterized protein isoform X1 n=1 Tax=Desmodus rotundus TaxID=9430 RepID=UPI0023810094|nr:uncharacterized protein LOC128780553 isoform X3 [Desmodus rotundus]